MTMITPSYLGETIEYSSLHACRSTLEDPTNFNHHLRHRTSRIWQHLDSLLYQIFEDLSSMRSTPAHN